MCHPVCPAPATGARCPFGLNGNRVQSPGCPRNGKQINTASGLLQYMQKASHWRSTWPRHRGARQRREGEAVGMGPRAPSHLPARIPACYLQHRPAGSSVMATGYAALSPHAPLPPGLIACMQAACFDKIAMRFLTRPLIFHPALTQQGDSPASGLTSVLRLS